MTSKEVKNPRRILILGDADSGVLSLLKDLTGSAPTPRPQVVPDPPESSGSESAVASPSTIAGLSHSFELKNAYYEASVPIWLDQPTTPESWKADFLSDEAGEVVRAVGAWIIVFRINHADPARAQARALMDSIKQVIAHAHGGNEDSWDGVCLAVGWPSGVVGKAGVFEPAEALATMAEEVLDFEDDCLEYGFEFVDGRSGRERDDHGELGGVPRVKEALEANDWNSYDDANDEALSFLDDDIGEFQTGEDENLGLDEDKEVLEEFSLLKFDVHKEVHADEGEDMDDEALQVQSFEKMMGKMMAIRDMSAHLPPEARRKLAAKTVNELMKDS